MLTYVKKSYFDDVQPQQLLDRLPARRNDLLKKMRKNKNAIKYIYAPSGYGKTSLAYDYVTYNHNWQQTFWFNCQSACFMRDLNSGTLVDQMLEICAHPRVVVFDDLIDLSGKSDVGFSDIVHQLFDKGVDVIITQNSIMNEPSAFNRNTIFIFGPELCVDKDEAKVLKMYAGDAGHYYKFSSDIKQPPCLIFNHNGIEDLILNSYRQNAPIDEIAVMFLMYVYKTGFTLEIETFFDHDISNVFSSIAAKYPHIMIDIERGDYSTLHVDYTLLCDAFKPRLKDIAAATKYKYSENFIDALTKDPGLLDLDEAYEVVRLFGDSESLRRFTTSKFHEMLVDSEFELAYRSIKASNSNTRVSNGVMEVYKCLLFTYIDDSCDFLEILSSFDPNNWNDTNYYCPAKLMSFAHHFEDFDEEILESFQLKMNHIDKDNFSYYKEVELLIDYESCRFLTNFFKTSIDSPYDALKLIGEEMLDLNIGNDMEAKLTSLSNHHPNNVAGVCYAYIYFCLTLLELAKKGSSYDDALQKLFGQERFLPAKSVFGKISKLIVRLFDERHAIGHVPCQIMEAMMYMDDIWGAFDDVPDLFDNACIMELAFSLNLYDKNAEKLKNLVKSENKSSKLTRSDVGEKNCYSVVKVDEPNILDSIVEISLFNNLNFYVDGKGFGLNDIHVKRSRVILAILAIANFREMPRDVLIDSVYQFEASKSRTSICNFYNSISHLKADLKATHAPNFIIKNNLGYKLDENIVVTDYEMFDALVNNFMFNVGLTESWEVPFARLKEKFSHPAINCIRDNSVINEFRDDCNNRLVDALLCAASRLNEKDDTFGALTLSRHAMLINDKREDVYMTLMKCQSQAHQRSQAIDTFFECKDFLARDLGISPSKNLVEEYERLIV